MSSPFKAFTSKNHKVEPGSLRSTSKPNPSQIKNKMIFVTSKSHSALPSVPDWVNNCSCWILFKFDLTTLLHRFLQVVNWNGQNWYIDFCQFSNGLSKLMRGFVKVCLCIFRPLPWVKVINALGRFIISPFNFLFVLQRNCCNKELASCRNQQAGDCSKLEIAGSR